MAVMIDVRELSKQYRLGGQHAVYRSLREEIVRLVTHPFRTQSRRLSNELFWALEDISFQIAEGEVVGIIGRNGAGKSTLLKILARITLPTQGSARLFGRLGSILEVGTGFHPELTGRENIFLSGTVLGMRRAEVADKLDEIVCFSELERFLDTPVKHYSSGMYVRLAFAVAAHLDPEILLVDEVLAVGDAAFQKKCLGKMEVDGVSGRTILFVSHNMTAIQRLCSKVIWIDNGRIAEMGDSRDVVVRYMEASGDSHDSLDEVTSSEETGLVIENVAILDDEGSATNVIYPLQTFSVEIRYRARQKIISPYFWVAISDQFGGLFGANMLFDDLRPSFIEGSGVLCCRFYGVRLMPQTYSVNLGVRDRNGMKLLVPTVHSAALFNVVGSAREFAMTGEIADSLLEASEPMQVSYEWRLPNGRVVTPPWSRRES